MTDLPLVARAHAHRDRTAIVASDGTFSYGELLEASARIAGRLLDGSQDLGEARVAFLVPPSFQYVATQWGIWRAGGIAVPLALSHPSAELEYVIADADAAVVVAHPEATDTLRPIAERLGRRFVLCDELLRDDAAPLPELDPSRRAMMVHTSGTTARPKGVVTTHANLEAQATSLVEAWEWTRDDRVLLVLPLHHVHGIVNVLMCALWSGAVCEMLLAFNAEEVWDRLASGDVTLFMAVPTIYRRLIATWEGAGGERQRPWSDGARRLRLMVSGSAALPVSTLERWREVTGHVLLERYGMTEVGMALSNPLRGERRPGFVGTPLPGVEVRLVDEDGGETPLGVAGEAEVRGPNVFREYWRRPEETAAAFRDGWFRTGDVAVVEGGSYRLLGRSSVDIIKTGGYKVSALEVEEVLREHPAIAECAVVGVEDEEWGERVCAAVELRDGATLALDDFKEWAKERLASYKVPRALRCVTQLPRNAMGKVVKAEVKSLFE